MSDEIRVVRHKIPGVSRHAQQYGEPFPDVRVCVCYLNGKLSRLRLGDDPLGIENPYQPAQGNVEVAPEQLADLIEILKGVGDDLPHTEG